MSSNCGKLSPNGYIYDTIPAPIAYRILRKRTWDDCKTVDQGSQEISYEVVTSKNDTFDVSTKWLLKQDINHDNTNRLSNTKRGHSLWVTSLDNELLKTIFVENRRLSLSQG